MLKILIVDDEFLVRVGLESTIPWSENGFHVVGSARNGKEAIPLFEKHDPDVLLTDIKMPVMGGLLLIETLKKIKPSLVAIIISHYDDFNYAQEALKLGANDYILKSELSPDNLINTIKRHVRNDTYTSQQAVVQENETLYQDFYSDSNFAEIYKKCKYFIDDKAFIALIIKLNYKSQKEDNTEDNISSFDLIKAYQNISSNIPTNEFESLSFYSNNREVLYIFKVDANNDAYLNYIELVRANSSQYLDIDTSLGVSSIYTSIHELRQAVSEAYQGLEQSFFEASGVSTYKQDTARIPYSNINTAFLKQSILNRDFEKIDNHIEKVLTQLEDEKNLENTKRAYYELKAFVQEISDEKILNINLNHDFDEFLGFESLRSYIVNIFNQLSHTKTPSYSFVISRCIKYIEENYKNNISLSDLAEYTHKSKSYLSTLFKLETNVNFSQFLINFRIEKAKQLLKESDNKIYEIAEQVGFNNPYYFSKVFKETTGLCSKDYRDRHYKAGVKNDD